VDIEQTIVEVGTTYEIARWNAFGGSTAIDLLAGARYWHQNVAINLALTATLDIAGLASSRERATARAGGVDWVDPLVGLRLRHQLAPGQELLLRGDVGGFDAGSQFSWNVLATYSWQFSVHNGVTYSGLLGYRALSVDFEKGSGAGRYDYDVVQHGPLLGLMVSLVARVAHKKGGGGFARDTITRFMRLIVLSMAVQFALTGLRQFGHFTN
jgi:hypothetical protein